MTSHNTHSKKETTERFDNDEARSVKLFANEVESISATL